MCAVFDSGGLYFCNYFCNWARVGINGTFPEEFERQTGANFQEACQSPGSSRRTTGTEFAEVVITRKSPEEVETSRVLFARVV